MSPEEIKQSILLHLQNYWDKYWSDDSVGLCPLCVKHECEESQRDSGFVLSPILTAKPMADPTPYDISQYSAICIMHGWQVRIKVTDHHLVSVILSECLQELAEDMVLGVREQIEQQMLYKLLKDINETPTKAISKSTTSLQDVFKEITAADVELSEQQYPEYGRWIIIDATMKRALQNTRVASESDYIRDLALNCKAPYQGFNFYTLDTNRFSSPFRNILNDRLIFFHEKAVGCAYSKNLAVTIATSAPSNTYFDCELRFGTVTNAGAGTGQIVIPAPIKISSGS